MNINTLILAISLVLGAIYIFFKPFYIAQNNDRTTPQIELNDYLLFEFDTQHLAAIAFGKKAQRFTDRDVLYDFVFNNNVKGKISTLTADKGVQKEAIIDLFGEVLYADTDIIEFESEHAVYDKNREYAISDVPYTGYMGKSSVQGRWLSYDLKKDFIKSKNIYVIYNIKEEKK